MGMDEVGFLLADVKDKDDYRYTGSLYCEAHRPGTQGVLMRKLWFRVDLSACVRRRTLTILQKIVGKHWETSQKECQRGYASTVQRTQDEMNECNGQQHNTLHHTDGLLSFETRRIDGTPAKTGINNPWMRH